MLLFYCPTEFKCESEEGCITEFEYYFMQQKFVLLLLLKQLPDLLPYTCSPMTGVEVN